MTSFAKGAIAPVGLLLLLALLFATPAEAKKRRHVMSHHGNYAHHMKVAKSAKVKTARPAQESPAFSFADSLVSRMERDLGTNPTGWARVWCGYYLGLVARSLGMKPPAGYPAATQWAQFGVPSAPAPGVVAVMHHHVGVVRRVLGGGKVELISGNHGHRVGIGIYSMNRIIAFRAPG